MPESISLSTPVSKTTSTWSLQYIGLNLVQSSIVVELLSDVGDHMTKVYDGNTNPTGATLLHTLNTANFSVNSLVKQVFNRLIADGVISAGTVVGLPS